MFKGGPSRAELAVARLKVRCLPAPAGFAPDRLQRLFHYQPAELELGRVVYPQAVGSEVHQVVCILPVSRNFQPTVTLVGYMWAPKLDGSKPTDLQLDAVVAARVGPKQL